MIYDYKNVNKYITEGRFSELIRISEEKIRLQFETLLKLIRVKDAPNQEALTDLLMVTGPSSSGKTTTAHLLAKYLSEDGYNCTVISLDNYYYDIETTHRIQIEKGMVPEGSTEFDYETIEAIDVQYFRQQMKEYTAGHSIRLPKFDFTVGKRVHGSKVIESTKKDMIIVEGIHAFNPILTEGLDFSTSLKIYICPFDSYVSEYEGKAYLIEPHQIRFLRRAIRDGAHRASPLGKTMDMWGGVRRGEKNYMEPLIPYTDVFFNSSHEYEIAYLKQKILEMAAAAGEQDQNRLAGIIPPEALRAFLGKEGFEIPADSLFGEFYV
ncbi:MAG: uridine kinase [Clostridia bacterium]